MKKFLLTFAAACAVTAASALQTDLQSSCQTNSGLFDEGNAVYNAPVAVGNGQFALAGSYTNDVEIFSANLEAIGTSAYVSVCELGSTQPKWTVGLVGSATVTALEFDNANEVLYVAGSFADEVSFGTMTGEPIVRMGMTIEGAATEKQNAAFIAKYDFNGNIKDVYTFVPSLHDGLLGSEWPMYLYDDGDIYFDIRQIKVYEGDLYVGAVYSGITEANGTTFVAPYVNYFSFMYKDLTCASIFKIDNNGAATPVYTMKYSGENADEVMDLSTCWSVRFDIDSKLVAAFAGCGILELNGTVVNEEEHAFVYAIGSTAGTVESTKTVPVEMSTRVEDNSIAALHYDSDNQVVNVAGRLFASVDDNDKRQIFVSVLDGTFEGNTYTAEIVRDVVSYYNIGSAVVLDKGDVAFALKGYYNKYNDDAGYKKGDFANSSIAYAFTGGKFEQVTFAGAAETAVCNFAADNDRLIVSSIEGTGYKYGVYGYEAASITDIAIDAADAPAEYFNLQGVRVANPENGLYIVRQGDKVTKQVIRR